MYVDIANVFTNLWLSNGPRVVLLFNGLKTIWFWKGNRLHGCSSCQEQPTIRRVVQGNANRKVFEQGKGRMVLKWHQILRFFNGQKLVWSWTGRMVFRRATNHMFAERAKTRLTLKGLRFVWLFNGATIIEFWTGHESYGFSTGPQS